MARPTKTEAALIAERRTIALRLRVEGQTTAQIAEAQQADWPGRTARDVALDIREALKARREEQAMAADELRQMEVDRLDMLTAAALEVLRRRHVVTAGGKVVRDVVFVQDPDTDRWYVEGDSAPLEDDGPTLQAIETLRKLAESRRRLLGLDQPAKIETSQVVRFVIDGVDPDALA